MKEQLELIFHIIQDNKRYGVSIDQIMKRSKYARGTVTHYLTMLVISGNVKEVQHNRILKVYFPRRNKLKITW